MKKFAQLFLIVAASAASFTACKKDALQHENTTPVTMETQATRNNFPPLNAAPKLVKKDADSLVYNADGSLQKVMASASEYRTYVKNGNVLTASYFFNNAFVGKIEYILDASGRAVEDKHIGFAANNGTSPEFVYQYDASNRLIKRYSKTNPSMYIAFIWLPNTKDLHHVKWYIDQSYESIDLYFTYKPETDNLKTWSKRTSLDSYLNIFGSRPTKMIESEDLQNYDNPALSKHEFFWYKYNNDGYPTKQDISNFGTWSYVGTVNYQYSK